MPVPWKDPGPTQFNWEATHHLSESISVNFSAIIHANCTDLALRPCFCPPSTDSGAALNFMDHDFSETLHTHSTSATSPQDSCHRWRGHWKRNSDVMHKNPSASSQYYPTGTHFLPGHSHHQTSNYPWLPLDAPSWPSDITERQEDNEVVLLLPATSMSCPCFNHGGKPWNLVHSDIPTEYHEFW